MTRHSIPDLLCLCPLTPLMPVFLARFPSLFLCCCCSSWVGHEFVAKEMPAKDGKCAALKNGTCGAAFFAVSENDEQAVHITPEFQAVFLDNKVKAQKTAQELLEECRAKANAKLAAALTNKDDGPAGQHAAAQAMDDLVKCVEGGVAGTLERLNEEIAFQASVRTGIAATLENYTCLDDGLNTTEDVHAEVWTYQGRKYPVHIKHERPASRIHVVENFIDAEECDAMEQAAAKSLHRATVADGKGGSRLSENRKALQAGIKVDWTKEADGDPIARLSRRVYDYTNHVLGLNIKENGQEDLMSIQVCFDVCGALFAWGAPPSDSHFWGRSMRTVRGPWPRRQGT